jgi:hypothetical protein
LSTQLRALLYTEITSLVTFHSISLTSQKDGRIVDVRLMNNAKKSRIFTERSHLNSQSDSTVLQYICISRTLFCPHRFSNGYYIHHIGSCEAFFTIFSLYKNCLLTLILTNTAGVPKELFSKKKKNKYYSMSQENYILKIKYA